MFHLNFVKDIREVDKKETGFFLVDRCSRYTHNRNIFSREDNMAKTRLNISLDHDLVGFIKVYVKENRTSERQFTRVFVF